MKKTLFCLLILLSLLCFLRPDAPFAQEKPAPGAINSENIRFPKGDFTALSRAGFAKVLKVIDPQTIQLDDGSLLRLSGIHLPDLEVHEVGDFALTAHKILSDMLEGQSIIIHHTKKKDWGRINRMGHTLAHIERQSDKAWIQGSLIALGLAQTRTGQRTPEMAAQMYTLETAARTQKQGIWNDARFQIINADEASQHLRSLKIVEGKVQSVSTKNSRTYINFGKDWRSDFTVIIEPGSKRLFSKAGYDVLNWGGKHIRVRGWIGEYNGPFITVNHPQAIEILQ